MIYICNSFSLAMLPQWRLVDAAADGEWPQESMHTAILVESVSDPRGWLPVAEIRHGAAVSAVGHPDTAALFAVLLGRPVVTNRISVSMTDDDELLVGQYIGPRLPEGSTELPKGAALYWLRVCID